MMEDKKFTATIHTLEYGDNSESDISRTFYLDDLDSTITLLKKEAEIAIGNESLTVFSIEISLNK